MRYEEFSECLLSTFPGFLKYFISDYEGDEIDMLPYGLSSLFINYADNNYNDDLIDSFIGLLQGMKNSADEEVVMLYNDILTDIVNTKDLKNIMSDYLLLQKDPHPNFTPKQVKENIRLKKITLEEQGKAYEENNKKLLEKYRSEIL